MLSVFKDGSLPGAHEEMGLLQGSSWQHWGRFLAGKYQILPTELILKLILHLFSFLFLYICVLKL